MNRYPKTALRPRIPRWAVGAAAVVALTGCGSEAAGDQSSDSTAPSSAANTVTPPAVESSGGSSAPTGEASTSSKPPKGESLGKTVVCDAIFTQETSADTFQVIGRPVVDANKYPMRVESNYVGAKIEPQTPQKGQITWYDLAGEKVSANDLNCNETNVFPKRIESANIPENIAWQLTTDVQGEQPKHWDLNALKPADFAGVSLNYTNAENPMTAFDVGELVNQAQHDAQKHPVYN